MRDNEIRELRAHLEQLIEDGVSTGHSREAATQEALSQFGDARSIGVRLRDSWDERGLNWKQVLLALAFNYCLWVAGNSWFAWAAFSYTQSRTSVLFPELLAILVFTLPAIIMTIGSIFAIFLGRRAWTFGTAFIGVVSFYRPGTYTFGKSSTTEFIFSLIFCSLGIYVTNSLLVRRRRSLLTIGGPVSSFILSPNTWSFPQVTKKFWKGFLRTAILVATVAIYSSWRIYSVTHPSSPAQALRVELLTFGDSSRFEVPRILDLQELPYQPVQGDSPSQRRVAFDIQISATTDYRTERVKWLRKQLALTPPSVGHPKKDLAAALQRVSANSFKLRGTAIAKKVEGSWQVEQGSFDFSRLWGWCEDIYFRE